MSKIKLFLISAAIIAGVFGAFAANKNCLCETQQQYYMLGSSYYPAGQYGVNYYCTSSSGTCTYYLQNPFDPNSFVPCRTGTFTWIGLNK